MQMIHLIEKKRDRQPLSEDEINFFIRELVAGKIPDYQSAALLMAIAINGMSREETVQLTLAMARSGDMLDLSDITDYAIDKHSSGGVGDNTTLVVLPLVASFGVPIAKMSGRGLGFGGGTLDKLEAIRGFDVNLSERRFRQVAQETGMALAGQSRSLAPADGILYALRDVTGTVPSRPLIASSIMSKKLAAGANGIVLDVKLGCGAFMTTLADARDLAAIMVQIGVDAGREMVALLSDMNQPLGVAVGNALEVAEAVETLQGGGPPDLRAHCIEVAANMLRLAGRGERFTDLADNRERLANALDRGAGMDPLLRMVAAQGGDTAQIKDASLLPKALLQADFHAKESGAIAHIFADKVGWATLALGAGRMTKSDEIDLAVGIEIFANVGDSVIKSDKLMTVHANNESQLESAMALLEDSVAFSVEPVEPLPLFHGVVDGADMTISPASHS